MGIFDFLKSKETREAEARVREQNEREEKERKKKEEWESLSEQERCRRVKEDREQSARMFQEYKRQEALWIERVADLLTRNAGEYYTSNMIYNMVPFSTKYGHSRPTLSYTVSDYNNKHEHPWISSTREGEEEYYFVSKASIEYFKSHR